MSTQTTKAISQEQVQETEQAQNTEQIEQTATEQTVTKKSSRSFKVKLEQNGPQYGRYNGDSPYQAANKALSEIIRTKVKNNESTDEEIRFFLVESTKGSNKKVHQYSGRRIKLDEPVKYTVAGEQEIIKEYKNILRKVKKSESNQASTTEEVEVAEAVTEVLDV
jgi:hypothetical protein